jgi:hypothetical protein
MPETPKKVYHAFTPYMPQGYADTVNPPMQCQGERRLLTRAVACDTHLR